MKPGHPSQIGSGEQGLIFIDDFEKTDSGCYFALQLHSVKQGYKKLTTRYFRQSRIIIQPLGQQSRLF